MKPSNRPIVWQLTQVEFTTGTYVSGVLLSRRPYKPTQSIAANATKVIGTYFTRLFKDEPFELRLGSRVVQLRTDSHGGFECFIDATDLPSASFYWKDYEVSVEQSYPTNFHANSEYAVISDIDDTAIRSYTASVFRRTLTTLFTTSANRKIITFTSKLANQLEESGASFHYVSKSERNLFGVLSAVFVHANVPAGPLYLTPYIRLKQLARTKPGLHKYNVISKILRWSPETNFFLFGDDTQGDVEVYSRIVENFPDQVKAVYIHRTRRHLSVDRQKELDRLQSLGVRFVYFDDHQDPLSEIDWIKEQIKKAS